MSKSSDPNGSVILSQPTASVEAIKANSHYLRGTLETGLADQLTGAISEDDNKLLKFHGSYQQDDRDLREERRRQKLEPAYQFMVRARIAGGVLSPAQWLAFDHIATTWANHSLRITTRQTFQLHGILKRHLKASIAAMNRALVSTIAACGDVNRNVVSGIESSRAEAHQLAYAWAEQLSEHLKPQTRAYHEIWLDGEKIIDSAAEHEPLYGPTYLPRKFKIGIAVPPDNDVDVFAQDLGLIAIIEQERLLGFNIAVGGGMGSAHGDPSTYPRLGSVIGFVEPERLLRLAEGVIEVQRDFGNREERKHARLKYTIDHRGLDWFVAELEQRVGFKLAPSKPYGFTHNGDRYGWLEDETGRWHLGLRIPAGRIHDGEQTQWLSGLREIAKLHQGEFRMTCNQNLVIARVEIGRAHV